MYSLTPGDLVTITKPEMAFGTMRLLPPWEEIPDEFKRGNQYTRLATAIFSGLPLPEGDCYLLPGFEESATALNQAVRAHLTSYGPKHQHKIAGVGYLISKAMRFEATE